MIADNAIAPMDYGEHWLVHVNAVLKSLSLRHLTMRRTPECTISGIDLKCAETYWTVHGEAVCEGAMMTTFDEMTHWHISK